ncbi:MAG: MoxR family ATPase [Defluviitaleaceae bacterium]|nr:MoxR family ATPase [Defluviitaleaceae bacterium]
MQNQHVKEVFDKILQNVCSVVIGREASVRLAIIALLAKGHVLLEDVPGSGKTLLAKSLAASVGCSFKRIQFTPDMLPSDITGINYFNMKTSEFEFLPGAVFANIVLADEINRATPKTQAGLLECMEERQVTIDSVTYNLAPPFMVIATQNPIDTQGVFPLPEAQLDRFTFKIPMQYTSHDDTVEILKIHQRESIKLEPVVSSEEIINAQKIIAEIFVHHDMMDYIVSLAEATRANEGVLLGVSARGALTLMRTAQTIAAVNSRNYVIPDDVKEAAIPTMAHRLILRGSERIKKSAAEEIVLDIVNNITVPTEFLQS